MRGKVCRFDFGDLAEQDLAALRIFIAKIDVDRLSFHGPGADQNAFENAMRIGFKMVPVLEGARLPFIGVDGHHSWPGLSANELPLAPDGEASAAQPAKAGVFQGLDDVARGPFARQALSQKIIAAMGAIMVQIDVRRQRRMRLAANRRANNTLDGRIFMQRMPYCRNRRVVAASHAGRANDAHTRFQTLLQRLQKLF